MKSDIPRLVFGDYEELVIMVEGEQINSPKVAVAPLDPSIHPSSAVLLASSRLIPKLDGYHNSLNSSTALAQASN